MSRARRDKADRAVKMLGVVPLDKATHPRSGLLDAAKSAVRIRGPILQRLKQRLRIRIIIADGRTAQRGDHPQTLKGSHHGCSGHRSAVVRMERELSFGNPLLVADLVYQLPRVIGALLSFVSSSHHPSAKYIL